MANLHHFAKWKLCSVINRAVPSIKLGPRALSSMKSDSNYGETGNFPSWLHADIKEKPQLTKKSAHILPESHLLTLTNNCEFHVQSLFKPDTIELTAIYYSDPFSEKVLSQNSTSPAPIDYKTKTLNENLIELPNISKHLVIKEPSLQSNDIFYINPLPDLTTIGDPALPGAAKIEEGPIGPVKIEKHARRQHRMLKIRKKKMKVHRRKRLWKRMWAVWKKKFFHREKNREILFRQKLIDKVRAAEKFNPEAYVDDYLEDFKYELTPKTYKARNKPQWLVKQLMERDEQVARRKHLNNTNMLTNEPLIRKGETIEEFVERNWK